MNDSIIICPICINEFNDPVTLPCGESICKACIYTEDGSKFECNFCNDTHLIPTEGFLTNIRLLKAINRIHEISSKDQDCLNFSNKMDSLKLKFEAFKRDFVQSETKIADYFNEIKNRIDLVTEQKIEQMNNLRAGMIAEVTACEEKCLNNLLKNDYQNTKEIENFINDNSINILKLQNNQIVDGLKKINSIKSKLSIESKYLEKTIFDSKKINFKVNDDELDTSILGKIKIENLLIKKCIDFDKLTFFTYPLICDITKIKVQKLSGDVFVFCLIDRSNLSSFRTQLYLKSINKKGVIKKNQIVINNTLTFREAHRNFVMKSFDDVIYIYFNLEQTLKKIDQNLNEVRSEKIKENATSMLVTDKFVILSNNLNGSILSFFDKDLNFVMKLSNRDSIINFPEKIIGMFSNDEFYLFVTEETLWVVTKENSKLKIEVKNPIFLENYEIIGFNNDNVIIGIIDKEMKIFYMNLDGEISDEIFLEGFDSPSYIFIDHYDDFQIIDLKKLAIFFQED